MISWKTAFQGYLNPRVLIFLFLGFSCGLPYNLLGYSLSLWMTDVGVALAVVGFFSLVLVPYSLKFLWAPFVDRFRVPLLSRKIGHKKAWALVFQTGLMISVFALSFYGPDQNTWVWTRSMADSAGLGTFQVIPMQTFLLALCVAFFAASQDIVVDALRIDTLESKELGEGASLYQFGYRMGMLLSGAGVVAVSGYLSWNLSYFLVGCFIMVGFIGVLTMHEPKQPFIKHDSRWFRALVVDPFADFMKRRNWVMVLAFVILYKLCNAVLGRMALPFYRDIGFSNEQIALVSGAFGPWVTLAGIALGGVLVVRYPILKCLFYLGLFEILTSCAFAVFSLVGASLPVFFLVIIFDNVIGGMGGAVFVAYLSGLCSRRYSATQYALLASLMALSASVISVYSGLWAEWMGWWVFFLFTGVLMVPALILLRGMIVMRESGLKVFRLFGPKAKAWTQSDIRYINRLREK